MGRSFRTAAGLPKLMCESRDLIVPKCGDPVSSRRLSVLMRGLGVL